jgi:hypothetical protein
MGINPPSDIDKKAASHGNANVNARHMKASGLSASGGLVQNPGSNLIIFIESGLIRYPSLNCTNSYQSQAVMKKTS